MPRALSGYGFEDETGLTSFVLDDPTLVDAAIARITEDIELITYSFARDAGREEIDVESVYRAYDRVLSLTPDEVSRASPEGVRDWGRRLVRDLARAPLRYREDAVEAAGDLVAAVVFTLLATGAENANREGGSRRIGTRHYLPACESWPYPLNRFC